MTNTTLIDSTRYVDSLVEGVSIPPCPDLLMSLQKEMAKSDFSFNKIVSIIERDPGLTAAVLKVVNSPYYGFTSKVGTISQAISIIGCAQLTNLISGCLIRKAFSTAKVPLTRFWDVSAKRSFYMQRLAKEIRMVPVDQAHCFGLFCDVGIPVLVQSKGAEYLNILSKANKEQFLKFTEIEQKEVPSTDHAILGGIMARAWGVHKNVCDAIAYHHDYEIFTEKGFNPQVLSLISLNSICEYAIQRQSAMNDHFEWLKFSAPVLSFMQWTMDDVEDSVAFLLDLWADQEVYGSSL